MTKMSVRPAKLADAVAQYIEELILRVFQPGERACFRAVFCVQLDVSRPSLRDALDILIERSSTTDSNGACYISEKIGQSIRDPLILLFEQPRGRFDCMEFRSVVEASSAALAEPSGHHPSIGTP